MRCKAAVLYEFNTPLVIEDVEISSPRGSEVLIKMGGSGVCQSDLSAIKGYYGDSIPAILGHEGAGVVIEVGPDVTHLEVGDHVVLSWMPSCRSCRSCKKGRSHLCETPNWTATGRMKDGTSRYSIGGREILQFSGISSFAEYSVVEEESAIKVDKSLSLSAMSLIGCGVTTGFGAAVNGADIKPDDIVVVIGCGGVGLSAIQGAAMRKAGMIIAVDRSAKSLELAMAMGATHQVNSSQTDATQAILDLTQGGVDFAFEAVGRKETMELASSVLVRGGEAILIGIAKPDTTVEIKPFVFVRREHNIRGSYYGSAAPEVNFPLFADYYRLGHLDLDSMIVERKLEDINDIFAEMANGSLGRNVIVFD